MTTTAPTTTTAPVRLREHWAMPTWVIADDPVTLAHAARVLRGHELCVMAQPYGGDLPAGALGLWAMGAHDDAAEVQLLLAAAGIPAVVTAVEVLDLETGETVDMVEPAEDPADDIHTIAAGAAPELEKMLAAIGCPGDGEITWRLLDPL